MKTLWFIQRRWSQIGFMQTLAVTGVGLSVAAWLFCQSIVAGFNREYTRSLLEFNADVMLMSADEKWFDLDSTGLPPEVISQTPFLYREALLIKEGRIQGVVLKGKNLPGLGAHETLLGKALAEQLQIGQFPAEVTLMLPDKTIQKLKATGTFETGLYEYDSQFAMMHLASLQSLFKEPKALTGWELKLDNPAHSEAVMDGLREQYPETIDITDWRGLNRDLFEALSLERGMFRIFMGLLVAIASLNMIATVVLHLFRRRQSVAVLRALGLPLWRVRLLFTLQGILLGTLGGGAGLGLSGIAGVLQEKWHWLKLDPEIYFIDHLPMDFSFVLGVAAVFGTLALCGAASWWAAGGSKKMSLREGLHGAD